MGAGQTLDTLHSVIFDWEISAFAGHSSWPTKTVGRGSLHLMNSRPETKTESDKGWIMKKNKTNAKFNGDPSARPVHIEFNRPGARTISIVGTFNEWRPGATRMASLGEGRWFKELMLKPGIYEYQLVVDGEWMLDPRAGETVSNPFAFGQMNSLLKVDGEAS
jgi:hypothetical protein